MLKKIFTIAGIIIVLGGILFILTGCNNNSKSSVENSNVQNNNEDDKISSTSEAVKFSTFNVDKRYYNDAKTSFAELKLNLPKLEGNYAGIAKINQICSGKEEFFCEQLPIDYLNENDQIIQGQKHGYYVSADYQLEGIFGNIISMSAALNGGAGRSELGRNRRRYI